MNAYEDAKEDAALRSILLCRVILGSPCALLRLVVGARYFSTIFRQIAES